MENVKAIDLFCGAGGLSEGFRQAGFHVLAGNDYDARAGETFAATHPEAKFISGPIQDVSVTQLMKAAGVKAGELDVLIGGPPCQAYSVYNHQRGVQDVRSRLFEQYLRIVEGLKPKWIVMENVTGITSIADGAIVREILSRLRKLGYAVEYSVLRAEEFGVPQERRRIFFIGNRTGQPISFPEATHGPGKIPFTTIWQAIGDLPRIQNGEDPGEIAYASKPQGAYQKMLRDKRKTVRNHAAPRLNVINIERMQHIPVGGSWRDIPHHLLPAGMKRAKRSDHTKRYGRMDPDGLSCTVLTKCDVHWGAYIHPHQDRSISVREAARIQSFPDWFTFSGSKTEQYVQVGNAVPPLLGKKVAEAVLTGMRAAPGAHAGKKAKTSAMAQKELQLAV